MEGREGDPEFVVVGHLSKLHGTKGEILVWPLTDRPATTFHPGVDLLVSDADGGDPDPALPPVRVVAVRPYRKGLLVFFEGIEDRDRAELLRDRYLLRSFDEIEPLEEGEIFYHQLLGLLIVTTDGLEVGRVKEVYGLSPTDLLEIEGEGRDHLIPFTRRVVVEWSVEEGRMVIDPPEGLLDL